MRMWGRKKWRKENLRGAGGGDGNGEGEGGVGGEKKKGQKKNRNKKTADRPSGSPTFALNFFIT